eukprot:m.43315 g.43315  ORF g.43315 m.43315 type:complete len:279 (-) comp12916_c0_seq1:1400-2236(-)
MGLCKCRVVTSLFCFQHTTNVCEKCMIESHPNCVVKTYLQWLNDTDFDPNCQLCKSSLDDGRETIRLPCFDVFHWECLDKYAKAFPAHTAPAGFNCPVCRTQMIPPAHNVSPVAQQARKKLATAEWATRAGDGNEAVGSSSPRKSARAAASDGVASSLTNNGNLGLVSRGRGPSEPTPDHVHVTVHDQDADKYASKPPNEWFERIVKDNSVLHDKSRRRTAVRGDSGGTNLKRNVILAVLFVVLLITAIELFTRARPTDISNDPLLDPMMNPNIRSDS